MKIRILNFTILLISVAAISIFQSCNSEASLNVKGTLLKGTITNAGNLQLFLDHINYDNSNDVIAKSDIDNKGSFEISLEEGIANGIYRIRIGVKKAFFVFDGSEKVIEINGDLANFEQYDFALEGSSTGKEFSDLMKKQNNQTINKQGIEEFVKTTSNPLMASFIALKVFANSTDHFDLLKEVSTKFTKADPDSKYAQDFQKIVQGQEAQYAAMKANERVQVGLPAPEIELESPIGRKYSLSDLKGKVVLIDFWASWCGPCRKANPHVVETYKKYKDKGFTVYSVSLDGINPRLRSRFKTEAEIDAQMKLAKEKWVKAIEQDGLEWDTHVSDLQYWNSIAAQTYGVRSIPQTFLIDREGKIAAINPRNNLEEAILKVL